MFQNALAFALLLFSANFLLALEDPICLEISENNEEKVGCEYVGLGSRNPPDWRPQRLVILEQGVRNENQTYTNATIVFRNESEMGSLSIKRNDEQRSSTYWTIEPYKNTTFPLVLKIAYIPFPKDVTTVLKYSLLAPSEENCTPLNTECGHLLQSKIMFKKEKNKAEITVRVDAADFLIGLLLEVLSNGFGVNCQNGISEGPVEITQGILRNSSERYTVKNLKPNHYYCARAILGIDSKCCLQSSDSEYINETYFQNPGDNYEALYVTPPSYITYILLGVFIVFVIGVFIIKHKRSLSRNLKLLTRGMGIECISRSRSNNFQMEEQFRADEALAADEEESLPTTPLTSLSPNSRGIDNLVYPRDRDDNLTPVCENRLPKTSHVEVLLLYPKESDAFQYIMDSFRNLLKLYVSKIWDPHDEDMIEMINENWWHWVENVLTIPNLKVIVVETDKTREWVEREFRTDPLPHHFIEGIFYYAIGRIREDQQLCRDYTRLFRVRLDSKTTTEERISLVVPFTCYVIPQHLTHLINVVGESKFEIKKRDCIHNEELKTFEDALKKFEAV